MKREEEIFGKAVALTSPEARADYLLKACGGDADLRQRLEELLAAHRDAGALQFLGAGNRTRKMETVLAEDRLTEKPGDSVWRRTGRGGMRRPAAWRRTWIGTCSMSRS